MPYKDLEKQKEYNRERMRVARGVAQEQGSTAPNMLPDVQPSIVLPSGGKITPELLNALVDKRHKLLLIYESLKSRHLTEQVRYGVSGPTFTEVGELLEVTT